MCLQRCAMVYSFRELLEYRCCPHFSTVLRRRLDAQRKALPHTAVCMHSHEQL